MKIVMIANALAVHTQRWAKALHARGHEVTVISSRHAEITGIRVLSRCVGPIDSGFPLWPLLTHIWLTLCLPFDLRRLKPDVVNAHYCTTHGVDAAIARAKPRVVNVWGSDLVEVGPDPTSWRKRQLIRFALKDPSAIVSTSRYMAEHVKAMVPDHPPIHVVPFGSDTSAFRPRQQATSPESKQLRVGFLKTFSAKYAPELLVEAASRIQRDDIAFVMAGDGPQLDATRMLARDKGLSTRFEFPGRLSHDNAPAYLRTLDIFVNCSRVESFGVVICEASATGLPVIVTDIGGVRETVREGETGLLIPPDDPQALADAIRKLADDADLRRQMGQAGRAFVQEHYEWSRCVDDFGNVLRIASETRPRQ